MHRFFLLLLRGRAVVIRGMGFMRKNTVYSCIPWLVNGTRWEERQAHAWWAKLLPKQTWVIQRCTVPWWQIPLRSDVLIDKCIQGSPVWKGTGTPYCYLLNDYFRNAMSDIASACHEAYLLMGVALLYLDLLARNIENLWSGCKLSVPFHIGPACKVEKHAGCWALFFAVIWCQCTKLAWTLPVWVACNTVLLIYNINKGFCMAALSLVA